MDDGSEMEFSPGDVYEIPRGTTVGSSVTNRRSASRSPPPRSSPDPNKRRSRPATVPRGTAAVPLRPGRRREGARLLRDRRRRCPLPQPTNRGKRGAPEAASAASWSLRSTTSATRDNRTAVICSMLANVLARAGSGERGHTAELPLSSRAGGSEARDRGRSDGRRIPSSYHRDPSG